MRMPFLTAPAAVPAALPFNFLTSTECAPASCASFRCIRVLLLLPSNTCYSKPDGLTVETELDACDRPFEVLYIGTTRAT